VILWKNTKKGEKKERDGLCENGDGKVKSEK